MRAWEQAAIGQGTDVTTLMRRAGHGVADCILADPRCADPVVVLAGPGNNGGDAVIAAQRLYEHGRMVRLILWRRDSAAAPPVPSGIQVAPFGVGSRWLENAGTIVDGLLGTGRSRPAEGELQALLATLAQRRRQPARPMVVSIDMPSGMDADTGACDANAVQADITIALGCAKAGTLVFPAAEHAGEVRVIDIGLPADAAPRSGETISRAMVAQLLPRRQADSNKGSYGRVTVIGGSEQYTGAPCLAARAAGRVGAGLVAVAMPRAIHATLATKLDEAIFAPQPDAAGAFALSAVDPLVGLARRSAAVALGPGLSQQGSAPEVARALLRALRDNRGQSRLVVDADALNALAQGDRWWEELPPDCVLTPHPGEMGRLCGTDARTVQANRVGIARESAARWRQHVLLKGAHTIIADPDGRWWLLPAAIPALATAGTGDVLTGIIAGLLAQGIDPSAAAICGAWLHAEAGAAAARQHGMAGVLAGDLPLELPRALQRAKGVADGRHS